MGKNRKPRHEKLPVPAGSDIAAVADVPSVQEIPESSSPDTGAPIGGGDEKPDGSGGVPLDGSLDQGNAGTDDQGSNSSVRSAGGSPNATAINNEIHGIYEVAGESENIWRIETVTYPDGVTATGTAPLPPESPEKPENGHAGDPTTLSITGEQPQQDPLPDPEGRHQSTEAWQVSEEPEVPAEQLEEPADHYVPLMTLDNIAQAGDEAGNAVAIQAGETRWGSEDSEQAKILAEFVRQWPEAPVSAMVVHVCRKIKAPIVDFDELPEAIRLALRVMRLVFIECFAAEREHRARFDIEHAAKLREGQFAGVDRDQLAMTPEDDNLLSELGLAAARR